VVPRELRLLRGKVRRWWLVHFRPRYVAAQLQRRRGRCVRCGECCRIVFRCPWLRDGNRCAIYPRRALQCRMFPIDERDLEDVPRCSFRFVPPQAPRKENAALPDDEAAGEALPAARATGTQGRRAT